MKLIFGSFIFSHGCVKPYVPAVIKYGEILESAWQAPDGSLFRPETDPAMFREWMTRGQLEIETRFGYIVPSVAEDLGSVKFVRFIVADGRYLSAPVHCLAKVENQP
jgi:hypothetical protein